MPSHRTDGRARRTMSPPRLTAILLALNLAGTTACSSLLDVDTPGRVPVDALDDPSLAAVLEAGAIQQFQCAFAQYVATAGVLTGEYIVSNFFVDATIGGWRGVETTTEPGSCPTARTTTSLGFYTPLQQARFQLDDAAARVGAFTDAQVPNRSRILAEMAAYGGYSYTLLGEGMCEMTIDRGPRMTRAQVFAIAETRFTEALALAATANDASLRNMAYVGRARTRLNLANLAGAAADAALVPAGYVRLAEFSETTPARENRLFNLTIRNDFLSVGPAYRGLTVGTQADPRVRVTNSGRTGPDAVTPMWVQQKFTGSGAVGLPIASWAEAQLILAEASGGQTAVDAINRVRAAAGVAPLVVSPGSDITALVLEERRRQLFSEGHRLGDMLRKNIPFATGLNHKAQSYGPTTCVPLPDVETQNNPNLGA
jgi:hypothetical protein